MKRSPWLILGILAVIFMFGLGLITGGLGSFWSSAPSVPRSAILVLNLEGVITDGQKFLKALKKYRTDDRIKAIVIRVNSPGGVVGPSQEINAEILKTRLKYKKPVVVAASSVDASGAFYASVAADKIYTNPGTLMGSIGVIMEFANLENLYHWAKIQRYALTTGPFKDAGAEYRPMKPEERALFQSMLNEVLMQFKKAVSQGRKMDMATVSKYADGRVFTGETAVRLGFADSIGTFDDAVHEAAKLGHIKGEPEIFEPPKHHPGLMQFLMGQDDDDEAIAKPILRDVLGVKLLGKPLFLMPGQLVDYR